MSDRNRTYHKLECATCGQEAATAEHEMTPMFVTLFKLHHRGHDVTETIAEPDPSPVSIG